MKRKLHANLRRQDNLLGRRDAGAGRTRQEGLLDSNTDIIIPLTNAVDSGPVDIGALGFDPHAPELTTTWSTDAANVVCLNTFPNGVTFSLHPSQHPQNRGRGTVTKNIADESVEAEVEVVDRYIPAHFHLRTKETREFLLPSGKYFAFKEQYAQHLEKRLSQLHEDGSLQNSVFYVGTITDPFSMFHKKFDVTMTCLQLLEHYRPGLVVLQTRSPMAISALPMLKVLGERAVVVMPIESHLEASIARYTPGQPKIADRLLAANGLRLQGIKVNLAVSPVLPYGDLHRESWEFAELLERHADYITLGCLADGGLENEAALKAVPLARQLAADKQFKLLRPYAYRHLFYALKVLCPEKLKVKPLARSKPAQLNLFAA